MWAKIWVFQFWRESQIYLMFRLADVPLRVLMYL